MGLVLMGGATLSKTLIQFSVDGWSCVPPPPAIFLGPNYGGGNEDNGDLPQKIPCLHCYSLCPQPHASAGGSWTHTIKSPVGSLFLSFGFCCTRFCCALQESISQSCASSGSSMVVSVATSSKNTYVIPTPRALSLQQTATAPYLHGRCPKIVLSQSLWGSWVLVCTRFV